MEQLVKAYSSHWADSDLFLFLGNLREAEVSFVSNYVVEKKNFNTAGDEFSGHENKDSSTG